MTKATWSIVRDALAGASAPLRRQLRWIAMFWIVMVGLQAWDSRDGRGAAGLAEFLSAVLGSGGAALLGLAYTLQRAMEEAVPKTRSSGEHQEVQQILIALPAIGFAAGVALGGAALLMALRLTLGVEPILALVGTTLYTALILLAARTVVRSARTLFQHAARHAAAAAEARSQAAAAQVAALQARMNPHFLFNALNTVASLLRSDPRLAERTVEDLSDVLRRTLERSTDAMSTVAEEIDYVRAYLALEQARWGERMRIEWDVDEDLLSRPLPPLVLQPLVENALHHGLASRISGGTIRLAVHRSGDVLTLEVADDGEGFSHGWREGTGLGNLRERLMTLHGPGARLHVDTGGTGGRVVLILPLETPIPSRAPLESRV